MATYTPTRMVLNQLKGRLTTARRGHKLLKDKRDELMRQFMDIVKQNKELRKAVEEGLTEAFTSLSAASAVMSPQMLEQALLYPRRTVDLDVTYKNVRNLYDTVRNLPADRILIESEAPFMTPARFSKRRNKPEYLPETARAIANMRGVSIEEMSEILYQNSLRAFHIEEA